MNYPCSSSIGMTFAGKRIAVSLPDTVLEEAETLREKTVKLGFIARACSIYGVDRIEIFNDPRGRGERDLILKILQYVETPQYLRKRLYKIDEALRYAGLLHPLRIPSHKKKTSMDSIRVGEVREGVTNRDGTAYIGLDMDIKLTSKLEPGRRVTVRVVSLEPFVGEVIQKEKVSEYWGYTVVPCRVQEIFEDREFKLRIATSRYGSSLKSVIENLRKELNIQDSVRLIFGSPSRGLFEIVGPELTKLSSYVVNLFLEQHVETVRTEEALFAALNLINNLLA